MLLVSRSMDLWKIACIASLCSCDKLSFPSLLSSASSFIITIIIINIIIIQYAAC